MQWVAQIGREGKQVYLGAFSDDSEAARAYDLQAEQMSRPLNFPKSDDAPSAKKQSQKRCRGSGEEALDQQGQSRPRIEKRTSEFKGVRWCAGSQKWLVECTRFGQRSYLGLFESESEAAEAYRAHAEKVGSVAEQDQPYGSASSGAGLLLLADSQSSADTPESSKASTFRGVSWDSGRQQWAAQVSLQGRTIHLGFFDCEETAVKEHDAHGTDGKIN